MTPTSSTLQTTFRHVVLRGSAYEVGVYQARLIESIPGWKHFFESGATIPSRPAVDETVRLLRRYSPAVEEEVNGFCDTLQTSAADLIYYASTHLTARHCSHLVALPAVTANGHTLMGRNYDFGASADDMRLCSTFITGKPAHIGFSSMFFGRQEGINEDGLAVTASVGGMPVGLMTGLTPPTVDGLQFWAQVRAMLEECRTVSEAQALFEEIPNCGNPVFLIADATGAAIVAEANGRHKVVRPVEAGWAVATNHYTSAAMRRYNPTIMNHSLVRHQVASRCLAAAGDRVTGAAIQELLGTPYPQGLACHYYTEFFGTLHSVVFDLVDRTAWVTFGSPAVNPSQPFGFGAAQPGEFAALLPQEQAEPDFWTPVVQADRESITA